MNLKVAAAAAAITCSVVASAPAYANFDGPYAAPNWTQDPNGGVISLAAMPVLLTLVSNDDGSELTNNTDFTITAAGTGTVSFSWGHLNGDIDGSGLDPFGYLINGYFTQLSADGNMGYQGGTASFEVVAGDQFGFRIFATDSDLGSSTASVYGFSAPVPEPETYGLMLAGLGLLAFLSRRRLNQD